MSTSSYIPANEISSASAGIQISGLSKFIADATVSAKHKLSLIQNSKSNVSIADMFDLQLLMNQLSQLSEMSTAVMSAANSAIQSFARNIKS